MQNSISTGNRKSTLGKLYDKVHKEYEEGKWVRDLVKGIQDELGYAIQVENQKLPIHCLYDSNKVTGLTQQEVDKVLKELSRNFIEARYEESSLGYGYFVVEDLR